jgi:uncharacterized protein YndB with AHSA1/START domain
MGQFPEDLTLHIQRSVDIDAPIATAFAALLEQLGPANEKTDGTPMPLTLEAWPGGRWFRDLGQGAGHLWGHVQVIKPPTLLEITGPLMMSYAAINHVQYRLVEQSGRTSLTLVHRALGEIDPRQREGFGKGWGHILSCAQRLAESRV